MILYCDFNPKLIRKYKVNEFRQGEDNVIKSNRFYASGYGIDMAVFSKNLFQDSKVFMLKGTGIGEMIEKNLRDSYIETTSVKLKDDNVEKLIFENEDNKTVFTTKTPRITMEDKADILAEFEKTIKSKRIVAISNIDHDSLKDDLYDNLIKICYRENVHVAVNPPSLKYIKDARPYLLILDKKDAEKDEDVNYTGDVPAFSKKLLDKGVGIVVVNSNRATVVSTKDKNYRVYFEKISDLKTYNKNLMLAGFTVGIDRDYDFETTIKLAMASSICENYMKFSQVQMSEIKKIMNEVKVEEM